VADATVEDMQERACVATQQLPGYEDADSDPATGCTNPSFTYCMTPPSGSCVAGPVAGCDDPLLVVPCTVTVTLHYRFDLIAPLGIDFYGLRLGLPNSLEFDRDSTFAMTDIDLSPGAP
jgi:hypothetical protein